MKVMTLSLPFRAHSDVHAGIVQWAQSMLCEFLLSTPYSSHGPRCVAGWLRSTASRNPAFVPAREAGRFMSR